MTFVNHFYNKLSGTTKLARYNIIALGVIGSLGHPLYWAIWTYVFPQLYDSFAIRFSAAFLCFAFLFHRFLPYKWQKYFPIYWFLTVAYALPFLFTVHLINNDFSDLWLMCEVGMGFMVISFIPDILLMVLNIVLGITLAVWFCYIFPSNADFVHGITFSYKFFPGDKYVPIWAFVLVAGSIFNMGGILGATYEKTIDGLKSLAASIAHEMRNPFSAINLAVESNKEVVQEILSHPESKISDHEKLLSRIVDNSETTLSVVKRGNDIINITLNEMRGDKPNPKTFVDINVVDVVKKAVKEYGYRSNEEKSKVVVKLEDNKNFIFRGDENLFIYVLFNLIKNALYYTTLYPDSIITIGSEEVNDKNFESQNYNSIYIHDSGPGIDSELLPKLFSDFVTSGKKEGTGLGLSFCKRTMKAFDGDIICESEYGNGRAGWTKFTIFFPKAKEEISEAKPNSENMASRQASELSTNINPKRVLIADDQEINVTIAKKYIGSLVKNVVFDEVNDGKEALDRVFRNHKIGATYDLIVMDVQMPVMSGIEAIKEIRKFDSEVIIINNTSRVSSKVKEESLDAGADGYIVKPIPNNGLHKIICKWLVNNRDFRYDESEVMKNLKGKNVLIADDEEVNLLMMKKMLQKYQLNVETVKDGEDLVEKYQAQFPNRLHKIPLIDPVNNPLQESSLFNKYDIIIVDLNMPKLRGDDAIARIRRMELIHDIHNKAIIMVNTGDDEKKLIRQILRKGADDYFIKGSDIKNLMQQLNFWLLNSHQYYKNNSPHASIANKDKGLSSDKKQLYKTINHRDINSNELLNDKLEKSDLIDLRESFLSSVERILKNIAAAKSENAKGENAKGENAKGENAKGENAKGENDLEKMSFETHALKGISGNIGAQRLFVYISIINSYAKTGRDPKEFEENWFSHLEEIYRETKAEFERL